LCPTGKGVHLSRAPQRNTIAFAVRGPIARDDLPGLSDRVCALLAATGPGTVRCDVHGVEPDAITVDALARLQLAARRHGCQVRLCNASDELLHLVAFMGLADVLPCDDSERARTSYSADPPQPTGGDE
jgi:ABC-type transporter Mla MlaB component